MKIKSLLIFGLLVSVDFKEGFQESDGHSGEYDEINQSIIIDKEIEKEELILTILHEMGHVLFKRIGLTQGVSEEFEEVVVEAFAKCITENFKLTPK